MLFSVGTEAYKNHFRLQGICRSVKKKKKIKSRTKETWCDLWVSGWKFWVFRLQGICRSVKKKKKIKSRTKEHGVIYGLVDGNSGSCPELGSNDLNEGCLNELGLQL
uniref:Uncharacterized protein n=1 Tax=Salix viminalis TaxID=40686 RepID=A0A6N2MN12_SALVM